MGNRQSIWATPAAHTGRTQQTRCPIPCCSPPTRRTRARWTRRTTLQRCTSWRSSPPAAAQQGQKCRTALHQVLEGTRVAHHRRWWRGRVLGGASSDWIRALIRRCSPAGRWRMVAGAAMEHALGLQEGCSPAAQIHLIMFPLYMLHRSYSDFCWNFIILVVHMKLGM